MEHADVHTASNHRRLPPDGRARTGRDRDTTETANSDDSDTGIDPSDEAVQLLEDVVENPFRSLTERYDLFANDYKTNQVKTELLETELVRERTLTQGTTHHKLLELTERDRDYIEDELDVEIDHRGRGGIIHRHWQHQIRDAFELAGWTAKIELFDADVYVHMEDKELAVEVAMGANDRELEHVKQRLDRDSTRSGSSARTRQSVTNSDNRWRRKTYRWIRSSLGDLETLATQISSNRAS